MGRARGLRGRTVTVLRPGEGGTDPFGAPAPGNDVPESVENVLVDQPSTEEIESTTRAYGEACKLTLHFPKTYDRRLRGCKVSLTGLWEGIYKVQGDPLPYDPQLTPGAHNRPVHVTEVRG